MTLQEERKRNLRKKFKIFAAVFKMLIFLAIIVGIPLYLYFFQKDLINEFEHGKRSRSF